MERIKIGWMACPNCKHPHMIKIREDTLLVNSICYCRKCKTENLINYKGPLVSVK